MYPIPPLIDTCLQLGSITPLDAEQLYVPVEAVSMPGSLRLQDINEEPLFLPSPYKRPPPSFQVLIPAELPQALQQWSKWLDDFKTLGEKEIQTYVLWLAKLPLPTHPFWQTIPLNQIGLCLSHLCISLKKVEDQASKFDYLNKSPLLNKHIVNLYYLMVMKSTAIAFELINRVYPKETQDWGLFWDPTFIDRVLSAEMFLGQGSLQRQLYSLAIYFKAHPQNKKGILLNYDLLERYSLEDRELNRPWNQIEDEKIGHLDPLEQHFKSLSQFISPEVPYSLESFSSLLEKAELEPYRNFEKIVFSLFQLRHDPQTLNWGKENGNRLIGTYGPTHAKIMPAEFYLSNLKRAPQKEGKGAEPFQKDALCYGHVSAACGNARCETTVHFSPQIQTHPEDVPLLSIASSHGKGENRGMVQWHEVDENCTLDLSQKVLSELSELAASHNEPNRVILILSWMEKRGHYLRYASIQNYIFKLLLGGLYIEETHERAPYVLTSLRSFLQQLIHELEQGSERERPHLAFWLRLGYLLETRLVHKEQNSQIDFYQEKIQKILSMPSLQLEHLAEFKLLWILVHSHLQVLDIQKAEQFTCYLLELNEIYRSLKAQSSSPLGERTLEKLDLLRLEVGSMMLQWQEALQEHFKGKDIREWLESHRLSGPYRGKIIRGEFPYFRVQGHALDLIYGHYEGTETQVLLQDVQAFEDLTIMKPMGIGPQTVVEYDAEKGSVSFFNGLYRCFKVLAQPEQPLISLNYTTLTEEEQNAFDTQFKQQQTRRPEQMVITKDILHNGLQRKYAYQDPTNFNGELPRYLLDNHTHWLSLDLTQKRYILIFDQEGRPCCKVVPLENQRFECLRLNQKGDETPEKLVVFSQLSQSIQDYLKAYMDEEYLKQAFVWVDSNGCIRRISIPSLQLTFIPHVSQKGVRLASKEFPGQFLISHQAKGTALPKKAFMMGKSSQKQLVIIPSSGQDSLKPTVALTWNRRRHFFEAQAPEEQLTFISFLMKNGFYLQAKRILDALEPLHPYGKTAYSLIEDQAFSFDQSPEAGLLYTHLLLHFFDNQQHLFSKHAKQDIPSRWSYKILLDKIRRQVASLPPSQDVDPVLGFTQPQKALLEKQGIKTDHLPNAPLQEKMLPVQIGKISQEYRWYPFPLESLATSHYTTLQVHLPPTEFAFAKMQIPDENLLAKKMHEKLTQAHATNAKRPIIHYTAKSTKVDLEKALREQMAQDKQKVTELMLKIEQKANKGLKAGSKSLVFHDQILRSLLKQAPAVLSQANSGLSTDEITQLWSMAIELMLAATRVDQAKEALKLSDVQEIAKVLHKQRLYDPCQYPAFLIYEYTTGFFLRPEQIDLLKWILNQDEHSSQLLAEFQAGGGKTKVISPLLCFFAIQKGLIPIFFSLPETYSVVKQDLQQSLQNVFEIKTHVLEIDLESELSEKDLAHILAQLQRWRSEGTALVITPVAYHKLRLCLYQSLDQPHSSARTILTFLQSHSLFIIDEAHRNLVSTWQAIVAIDEKPCLQQKEQDLFITIYKLLTGVIPCTVHDAGNEFDLGTYVRLKEDGQSSLEARQKKAALKAIASWLCHHYFRIDPERLEEAIEYLSSKQKELPAWGEALEQKELFFLARGLITQVLKTSLKMMHQFDYGAPMEGYSIEMPRLRMAATGAQLADPDLAAALTCQGLYQRGVDLRQFTEMLQEICDKHKQESEIVEPENTQMARLLHDWQAASGLKLPVFIGDIRDAQDVLALYETLKLQPLVIEYYLAHYLLAKVKSYNSQMVSTAAELNGGARTILFSATLGMAEEYPAIDFLEQKDSNTDLLTTTVQRVHRDDLCFQAAVIQRACKARENSQCLWLESSLDPDVFFEQVYSQDKTLFPSLEGMIDVGGWLRYSSTEQVAQSFLRCNQKHNLGYQGAVFMREESAGKSSMQLILAKGDSYEYLDVCGTDFLEALKNHGWEHPQQVRLFKIYGPSQATGTDMYLSKKAKMLLTVGSKSTLWDQIQAIMRCRKFLEPALEGSEGQSIVWVGSQSLRKKIAARTSCQEMGVTPEEILQWCFEQEMKKAEPRIILQACQSILHVIRRAMEAKLSTDHQWVVDHQIGVFLEKVSRDLALQYAFSMVVEMVTTLLENYTKDLLNRAGLQLMDFESEQPKINAIIAEAANQVATTRVRSQSRFTSTLQAHQQQHQQHNFHQEHTQRKQSNQLPTSFDTALPQLDYAQSTLCCMSDRLAPVHNGETIFSANATFCPEENFFYKNLFFLGNVRHTTQEKPHALKAIDFFLLVISKDEGIASLQVYCVSHEDAEHYAQQLASGKTNGARYMALCSSSGHLAQNGCKNGIPEVMWNEITKSPLWQNIINQIALLNCHVVDSAFLTTQFASSLEKGISEDALDALFKRLSDSQYFSSPSDGEYLHSLLQPAQKPIAGTRVKPGNTFPEPALPAPLPQAIVAEKKQLSPPSVQTASKVHHLIVLLVALLGLAMGVAGGLSLLGGYWVHAPQFAMDLYKVLPHWVTYAMVATSGCLLIGLITYAISSCCQQRAPVTSE